MTSINTLSLEDFMTASNINDIIESITYEATRRSAKESLKEISVTFGSSIDDTTINNLLHNLSLLDGKNRSNELEGARSLRVLGEEIIEVIKQAWIEEYNSDNK
jgi:hypothetical protein